MLPSAVFLYYINITAAQRRNQRTHCESTSTTPTPLSTKTSPIAWALQVNCQPPTC
jgi:hypothetical protein